MKANRFYIKTKQPVTVFKISFDIDSNLIEATILLMMSEYREITRLSVEKRIRDYLRNEGAEFKYYLNEKVDDYDKLLIKSNKKSRELFPDFYLKP